MAVSTTASAANPQPAELPPPAEASFLDHLRHWRRRYERGPIVGPVELQRDYVSAVDNRLLEPRPRTGGPMTLLLDGQKVHGKRMKITANLRIEVDDMSGQSSGGRSTRYQINLPARADQLSQITQ